MTQAPSGVPARPSPDPAEGWPRYAVAGAIALAALAAYQNSFAGPFIFDDTMAITDNPTIRNLGRIGTVLSPPGAGSVGSRPLINLSLAVNYAISGINPWSYHALNLLIHVLAGLVLFGIVRRTLLLRNFRPGTADAMLFAGAAALLWTLHPLQTESVTFVIQRTESLMGLFYLLTLYCFIRSATGPASLPDAPAGERARGRIWTILTVACCLLGMASKEVMVSAPLIVLLYDRTFVAGSFRLAWERRRALYLGLAATWIPLAYWVVVTGGNRGGAAGFGTSISPWTYALTQCHAIWHYLRLSVWPHPLVVDYGDWVIGGLGAAAPEALGLLLLLAGTVIALRWRPALGFLGAWFFLILAPSSSVVPLATQTIAEHRMYLPLAAPVVLAVLGLAAWLGRSGLAVCLVLAVGLGFLTSSRNEDYRSAVAIWSQTLAHNPQSSRAHNNLAVALAELPGGQADAIAHYEAALRLRPDSIEAHNNLGNMLARIPGRQADAIAQYEAALRLNPDYVEAHYDLAVSLDEIPGRQDEAIGHYEAALRLKPDYVAAYNNLANALARIPGRQDEAIARYQVALRLKPDSIEAHINLANLLARTPGREEEAIGHYEAALRLNPDSSEAHNNLANTLVRLPGRQADAISHYEAAVRLRPDYTEAHYNLAVAYAYTGQMGAAVGQLEIVVRLNPDFSDARSILGKLRTLAGVSK
jgi:protein O-mannosyl-transferase